MTDITEEGDASKCIQLKNFILLVFKTLS